MNDDNREEDYWFECSENDWEQELDNTYERVALVVVVLMCTIGMVILGFNIFG